METGFVSKEDNMRVLIRNIGCDAETLGLAEFENDDGLNNFVEIIKNLNQNSNYSYMPIIGLYLLFEDELVNIEEMDKEDKERLSTKDIIKWKDSKYIIANSDLYFSIITDPERNILH